MTKMYSQKIFNNNSCYISGLHRSGKSLLLAILPSLKNIDIVTCKIDQGISAIQKIKNKNCLDLKLDDFSKLKFKDFYFNHKEYMRIKDYNDFLKYISH